MGKIAVGALAVVVVQRVVDRIHAREIILVEAVPQGCWQVTTLVGAMRRDGPTAALAFDGATDAVAFKSFVRETLCPTLPPACPQGTTPGIANGCRSGYCIPLAECGHDPGECRGEVACDAAPPACPAGTVPGIDGACWSGYCIPEAACEPEACADLAVAPEN